MTAHRCPAPPFGCCFLQSQERSSACRALKVKPVCTWRELRNSPTLAPPASWGPREPGMGSLQASPLSLGRVYGPFCQAWWTTLVPGVGHYSWWRRGPELAGPEACLQPDGVSSICLAWAPSPGLSRHGLHPEQTPSWAVRLRSPRRVETISFPFGGSFCFPCCVHSPARVPTNHQRAPEPSLLEGYLPEESWGECAKTVPSPTWCGPGGWEPCVCVCGPGGLLARSSGFGQITDLSQNRDPPLM